MKFRLGNFSFFAPQTKQTHRRGGKRLTFEQLELRRLLAVITFTNPAGGSWHTPGNWDLGRIPASGDDAVILPGIDGNPTVEINSSATVRTITAHEAVSVNGGTLTFTQINQLAGNFTLNGGTLTGGVFTSGAMVVPLTGSTIAGLTIASGATLRVSANAQLALAATTSLTVNGAATFETGSRVVFETVLNFSATQIVVFGTLVAQGASFVRGTNNTPGNIVISSGGRLSAADSTFQNSEVSWDFGAIVNPTDLQRNRFDAELLMPADLIRMLSAPVGSDNRRFGKIKIRGGNFSGGALTLGAIGTETTQSLNYLITSNLQVASGSSLTVKANVPVNLAATQALTINGSGNFEPGSVFTFETTLNFSPTQLIVAGTLVAQGASFVRGTSNTPGNILINSGGRLSASDSTFQNSEVSWDFGAIVNPTDLQRNRFDAELLVPADVIRMLSAPIGSDNRRFGKIKIRGGNFTGGVLTLGAIGTETTQRLNYLIANNFQVASGSSLIVRANVPVNLAATQTLTINGSGTFEVGAVFTFETTLNFTPTQIIVSGTLVTQGASFVRGTNNTPGNIVVNSGGRLSASDSTFQNSEVSWDFGAIVNPTDLQRNRFDAELLVPAEVIRMLSAPIGSDNRRFARVKIRGGSFNSGNLSLGPIGTETTASLNYQIVDDLQINAGSSLTVKANVPVSLAATQILTLNGTGTFESGSRFLFETTNNNTPTQLVVAGALTTQGASFSRGTNNTPAVIVVRSSGRFDASESTFPGIQQQHAVNSNVNIRSTNGQAVEFGTGNLTNNLTEIDSFSITNGSTALVPASVRLASSALFDVSASSVYSTTGSLLVEPSSPLSFVPSGTFRFVGAGTTTTPQLLEAVSNDVGLTAPGFTAANYLFGSIEVGPNTWVRLTNQADNSPGATEAVYTNSLIVRAGATLDLMNFRLYTRAVYIEPGGRVINGDVEPVFRDGGNLVLGQPTPGKVDAVAQVDEWTFFARAGGSVALRLNPGSGAQPAAVAPQLSVGRVELVDPSGRTVAFAISPTAGALAAISSIVLPLEGIYKVLVSAPPSTPLATGNYVITATDTTPDPRDTAIQIRSSRTNEMQYGESVTFTVTVKPLAASGPNATGNVQFQLDGVNFGGPIALNTETALISVPLLQAGNRQLTVVYSGDLNNYNAKTSAPFTQVVNKVTLRFAAENKTKRAGEAIPTLTYLVNGFVNNETASVLSGQPSLSVPSQAINQAGSFDITISAGTLVAANYSFQFTRANMQVSAADPAVLTAISGSPQSTKAGRRFASAMTVQVEDAFGNRVRNAPVTFTSPVSGPSGIFENNDRTITVMTGIFGQASVAGLLSNETVGNYAVVATVNALNLNFQLTNNEQGPPLVLTLASDSIAERDGIVVATLRRNTPLGNALTAVLSSSNPQLVRVPSSITFEQDSDWVQFNLGTINNVVADGNLSVTITAASLTSSTSSSVLVIDDEEPKLNLLFSPLSIPENGGIATATISRNTPIDSAMVVTFSSPDSAYIGFPETVTIPAGANSASFLVNAIDDRQVTGLRIVSLTATTPGLLRATRGLEIVDNDVPALQISFAPSSVSENGGTATAVLTRNTTTDVELVVALATDQASKMQIPPTFTIPVGQASISFPIPLIDDSVAGGDVGATVSVTATDFVGATAILTIRDNELAALMMASVGPAVISEGGPAIELRVNRNTPTNIALPVTLNTNQPGQVSFPSQVEIPVGQSSITFQVFGIDDQLLDGLQSVQLIASAAGLQSGSVNVEVIDVVPLSLTLAASSISERNGSVEATVARPNSNISEPLVIGVSVSNSQSVNVPSTVTIPANQSQFKFTISAVDNALLDGSRTVQITTSANGYQNATSTLQITDFEQLSLTPTDLVISESGGFTIGTVRRPNSDNSQPLEVSLGSSSATQATVPASVRIEANQSEATFEIRAVDNDLLDGTRTVQISASATGYQNATTDLQIADFERLSLSLADVTISELGGITIGTVRRANNDVAQPIDVSLSSSPASQATIPAIVRIEANQSQATFEIKAIDNNLLDGSRTVQIVANVAGYQAASIDLRISDAEQLIVTISAPTIPELGGTALGTVRRPTTDVSQPLTVQLLSSDVTEANVQAVVTILAGQSSATFPVSSVDDVLLDGTQRLAISASASGYVTGAAELSVTDLERLTLQISPTEIRENNGTAIATITRSDTGSLGELTVLITAVNTAYASFPASITIPAGQATANFEVKAIDNNLFNAERVMELMVASPGFGSASSELKIIDDESLRPWRNPANRLDVNGDGVVSPADALAVINHLNRFGAGRLSLPWTGRFLDVSGEDVVSALDALQVINFLNRRGSGEGEGGGSLNDMSQLSFAATHDAESRHESAPQFMSPDYESLLSNSLVDDIRQARRNRRA